MVCLILDPANVRHFTVTLKILQFNFRKALAPLLSCWTLLDPLFFSIKVRQQCIQIPWMDVHIHNGLVSPPYDANLRYCHKIAAFQVESVAEY